MAHIKLVNKLIGVLLLVCVSLQLACSQKSTQINNSIGDKRIELIKGEWIATKFAFAEVSGISEDEAKKIIGAHLSIEKDITLSFGSKIYSCPLVDLKIREQKILDEGIFDIGNKGSMKPKEFELNLNQTVISFQTSCLDRHVMYFVYAQNEKEIITLWDGAFFLFKKEKVNSVNH